MSPPTLLRRRDELASRRATAAGPVAVVLTMGALHAGHAALIQSARQRAGTIIVTIFVNPLQFGPAEDFADYPRTLPADLELAGAAGADLVFAPTREEVYRYGEPQVRIDPGPLGEVLEGASRPGHFAGVLTVVHKLLQLTRADLTYFGEKDYQQLTLIRQLVRDLDLPVEVVPVPTIREPDGLARSSRNRYLSPAERAAARALPAALRAGAEAGEAGADPAGIIAAAASEVTAAAGIQLDYLALTDTQLRPLTPAIGTDLPGLATASGTDRLDTASDPAESARLLIAAQVGSTRLIDNAPVPLRGDQ